MSRRIDHDPCYKAAMPDEPAFVLLARDPMAPALVRLWVAQRRLDVANGVRPATDLPQIEDAEREAERMERWRRDANEAWRKQGALDFERPSPRDGKFPEDPGLAAFEEASGGRRISG